MRVDLFRIIKNNYLCAVSIYKTMNLKKIATVAIIAVPTLFFAQSSKYKMMLQMNNYEGEGAYIVASLVNAKGQYEKTLKVLGPDKKWYKTLKEWYKVQSNKPEKLNAITGASISGGERTVVLLDIDNSKLNAGYKIRLESAVEDGKYYVTDAEIPLTSAGYSQKVDGKGYIRYVKMAKAN